MITHGVALVKLSDSTNGCGRNLDEFYVVVVSGRILRPRFWTYASAFRYLERLQEEARADVA